MLMLVLYKENKQDSRDGSCITLYDRTRTEWNNITGIIKVYYTLQKLIG